MPRGRVLLLAVLLVAACTRTARRTDPVASLATTTASGAALGALHEAWEARRLERASAEAFLARYPADGGAPLARVYLAFALLEEGQLVAADGELARVQVGPGATRDLATIAEARSLRLHGAPRSALDRLRPLVGKVVDDADREIFLEELALAALAAHDDYEALAYLDAWLRGVGEEGKDRVREKIQQILDGLPREVLERTYRAMRSGGAASGYGADTQQLVAERLARIAVETSDAALARWLVEVSGVSAAQAGGDAGLELADLAASRRGISSVSGRTIGLLLPTRERELRDQAADVVRGMSWALGLPRVSGKAEEVVRFVTRDEGVDANGARAALEELAGEGATLIVAGFDRTSADHASAWSEASGVPVVLLSAPSPARSPKRTAIVLGEPASRELAALGEALQRRGIATAAFVAESDEDEAASRASEPKSGPTLLPPVRCDVPMAVAGKTRFPVEAWSRGGARGALVAGSAACARDVLRDLVREQPRATVALTLQATVDARDVPRGLTVLGLAAGVLDAPPEEDADVAGFVKRYGVRPSYWTALGHDAAALGRAALEALPRDTTTDAKLVAQRRDQVRAGLVATHARFWTSERDALGEDRILPRTLRVVPIATERPAGR